ncbi:hydantoinase/oxoprolinase family protein [Salinibacter grassmerensis]|uniref:hydantoinase/oxoprolinase family protein n=1 Tax=Salinibacter grassmerensis TaxID=3040353 RepID=UPI0021E6E5A2|nr:hydantoinase/oxoprolinase family protein [Salinibacter grassmerensis]
MTASSSSGTDAPPEDTPSEDAPPEVGVDVGGTFTDFVVATEAGLAVRKVPTTDPQHEAVGVGLSRLDVPPTAPIAHGTTTATNALLERRGAKAALVTTEGFADVLAIGRQDRPDLYDLTPTRPPPLVPAARRYGVPGRIGADGEVLTPLDEAAVRRVAQTLAEQDVGSVALAFLFSYRNPEHEKRAAGILWDVLPDGVPITRSSALLPEHREYERTATTVANAYVRPVVESYLTRLGEELGGRPIRVMQSSGGTIGLGPAGEEAARLALSGPAGGVVGALGVARRALDETPHIMTLDMGGTSADVALCDGTVPRATEHTIAGLPLRLPATDIHTVGAGGGSIAHVDAGGSLRVGPESAGAEPGPVCYGRGGTRPTVTDAHLTLGRLDPSRVLGGTDALDMAPDAARDAVGRLGETLDRPPEETALGVLRVANATMERALRRVSVERGHDPRDYTLVPFGGAGPLHAAALAETLGMTRVLVPPAPGALSALGLLMADITHDASRALLTRVEALRGDLAPLQRAASALAAEVRSVLDDRGTPEVAFELDLRYVGQSYEVTVPVASPITASALAGATEAFHNRHRQRYGHADPEAPVEAVALRARGTVTVSPPPLPHEPETDAPLEDAAMGTRPVWFEQDGPTETTAYNRKALHHGHALDGPAVLHQYDTTIVVPPGWRARVGAYQNVWIER